VAGYEYESACVTRTDSSRRNAVPQNPPVMPRQPGYARLSLRSRSYATTALLVSQHAYGIPDEHAPVLYLRSADDGDLVATYRDVLERIWTGALPLA
jgi:hypothetical protein